MAQTLKVHSRFFNVSFNYEGLRVDRLGPQVLGTVILTLWMYNKPKVGNPSHLVRN